MERTVVGTLHSGDEAEIRYAPVLVGGQIVWRQRGATASASHLNRDYVCNETFHEILRTWFPCDWKTYTFPDTTPSSSSSNTKETWGDCA